MARDRRDDRDDEREDDDAPRRRPRDDDDRDDAPRRRANRDDDADERPRRASSRRDDDDGGGDEDRPRRRSSRGDDTPAAGSSLNVCGLIGLILGIPSLIVTFVPCCGWAGLPTAIISLLLGIIGLVLAKGSQGRMGGGLAIAATILGGIATLIAILWMVFFGVLVATAPSYPTTNFGGGTGNPVSPSDPVGASVAAADLAKEVSDNRTTADAKYNGKIVEVTGVVSTAMVGVVNVDSSVTLKGQGFADVDCNFGKNKRSEVEGVNSGSTVTIRGRYNGMSFGNVNLTDCILMSGGPKGDGGTVKVTAAALVKAFTDNPVSAATKYEDKAVEVSGMVGKIDRDTPGVVTVIFSPVGGSVECNFTPADAAALANVKTGQAVKISGKCAGKDDAGPVVLEGCKVVK